MSSESQQKVLIAFNDCCKVINTLYEDKNNNTQEWYLSFIECCTTLNINLEEIIDVLEDWAADYVAEYTNFQCQEYDNEDIDFEIEFDDFLCQEVTTTTTTEGPTTTTTTQVPVTTTTTTVDPGQIDIQIEFDDYLCQQEFDPAISTTTTTIIEIVEFDAEYEDYLCQEEDNGAPTTTTTTVAGPTTTTTTVDPEQVDYDADYDDYLCQEVNDPSQFTSTTTTTMNEDVDYQIGFDDFLCQQEDVTTTTTTAGPTTTTTTLPVTTTTTSTPVTTTTTTVNETIDCGEMTSGLKNFPAVYDVELGSGLGTVVLNFDAISIPDKFVVYFDGIEVIDTGYRGDSGYQNILYDALSDQGAPPELIAGAAPGSASFYKGTATTIAKVFVYAPIDETQWEFTLDCPTLVTTTTTTIDPEEVDYIAEYEDYLCQEEDDGEPTTTTTTVASPTTTTTTTLPITTTTTTIELSCGGGASGSGTVFPVVYNIDVGASLGLVTLNFDSEDAPDKYTVEFDSVEVIDTGYRGNSDLQGVLDARLIQLGYPTETIQGPGAGSDSFNKTSSVSIVTVRVYAPLEETEWSFTVDCPVPITTTTTTASFTEVCLGYLYNWFTVEDVRNVSPSGWRVPTEADRNTFKAYLDANHPGNTAGVLKETGFEYWDTPNSGADNLLSFNGRGGGRRDLGGNFVKIKESLYFWLDAASGGNSGEVLIEYDAANMDPNMPFGSKIYGQVIRLMKEDSIDPGAMTDNDGNVYPTVKIGTQVWMAANLITTKYRNGDPIPNITDGPTWGGLSSGAYCIYDNASDDCSVITTTTTTSP